LLTPPQEMLPKHRRLHALCPKASGNAFQALVDPPDDGNNLSFDGGDKRTNRSNDNTIVNVYPCDSGPPVLPQHLQYLRPALASIGTMVDNIWKGDTKAQFEDEACLCIIDHRLVLLTNKMDSLLQNEAQ
jgi:hypothetical protein